MKIKLLLFLMTITFLSCKKEEVKSTSELEGNWKMTEIVSFAPTTQIINEDVFWSFDTQNNKINVSNSTSGYILSTGEYDYVEDINEITILDKTYNLSVNQEVLFLSFQPELDGPSYKFIKQ